ncbi:hypothetical protein P3342_008649 [Pyrenophora teres f. teres]|uniref:Uncharacterized protein n=1 Tax=Pyrenophora teres f. teres TaxID=97479 RepID=A0A6S6W6B3_9PLEO|nr:hypothetical protein HRS9139_07384 [Pyrenophora teres f. teres]KAE8830763.1 hypothetical protein PTNB85_07350 [Pyrenophora teres f. teres]KAE8857239.1 hypothetical protein PTNB29_08306 [Pyrenophora teres f. teres]KAE8863415.1 hypothetical protein PTNB73_06622 [Pyrenophora teres f. teres]KAK1910769.1 hypothetical protein P3342_008649 [Pyrenophora teres f. teres]
MSKKQYYDPLDHSQAQPPPWPGSANQSLISNTGLWPAEFSNDSLMPQPSNSQFDSGYVDNHAFSELADWHEKILQLWYNNNRRAACEDDIFDFYRLFDFKVDRAIIESSLQQMFSRDERNCGLLDAIDNYPAFDEDIATLLQPQTPAILGRQLDIPTGRLWPGNDAISHDLPNAPGTAYGHPDSAAGLFAAMRDQQLYPPCYQSSRENIAKSQFDLVPRKEFPPYIYEQFQLSNNGLTDAHPNQAIGRRHLNLVTHVHLVAAAASDPSKIYSAMKRLYIHRNSGFVTIAETWKDRCTHIMGGCKAKRNPARNPELAHTTAETTPCIGHDDINDQSDEDEDSDEDDGDEEDKSDNQSDDNDDDEDEDGHAPNDDRGQGGANSTSDSSGGGQDPRLEQNEGSSGGKDTSTRGADNYSFGGVYGWNTSTQVILPTLVSFTPLRHHQLPSRTLPVTWLGRINSKGGMASVYKVQLQIDPISGLSIATAIYAVKQYPAKHRTSFLRELNAYTILHSGMDHDNHIIKCYGTFECLDSSGNPTYNLLLEHAECDLAEYWAKTTPMGDTQEEARSWKLMFSMASALQQVHQTRQIGTQHLQGVHFDLKPDNILYTRNGQWKLCDFGFTKFTNVRGSMKSRIYVDGGTRKYQAPESKYSSPVNQPYDIWSMGCVMLELLVWIHGDYGIYRASEKPQTTSNYTKRNCGRSGFHNGFGILPSIKGWFQRLKNRNTDEKSITRRTLDIVENHLLVIDPSHRFTAKQLQCRLAEFLELYGTTHKDSEEILHVAKLMLAYELARSAWFFYERSWFDLPTSYTGDAPSLLSSSKLNKLGHMVWMDTLPGNVRDAIITTRVLGYRSVVVANGFIRVGQTTCPSGFDVDALHTTLVGVKDNFPSSPRRGRKLRSCEISSTPGKGIWSKLDDSCIGILVYGRADYARVSI